MLSSMVATSCMLETRASSQLEASEKNDPGNSDRAHSSSDESMPMDTRVGASFQASCTSAFSIHSARASSASLCSSEFMRMGFPLPRAYSCSSNMQCFCSWIEVGLGELGGELMHAQEVVAEFGGGADGGGTWVVELVHEACGKGAERGHFFLLDDDALVLLQAVGHVAEDGFADLGAVGHDVPELLFVQADGDAGLGGLGGGGVGSVGEQLHLAHRSASGHDGHGDFAASGRGLKQANFARKQDPEEMSGFALAAEEVALPESELRWRRAGSRFPARGRRLGLGRRAGGQCGDLRRLPVWCPRPGHSCSRLYWIPPMVRKASEFSAPKGGFLVAEGCYGWRG